MKPNDVVVIGKGRRGGIRPATLHVLEAVRFDRPVMATPSSARTVMEVRTAADLSSKIDQPVDLPLSDESAMRLAAGAST